MPQALTQSNPKRSRSQQRTQDLLRVARQVFSEQGYQRATTAHIAEVAGVSEATVKAHMTAILRKLGASNRTQAVLMAGRLAVDPDSGEPG